MANFIFEVWLDGQLTEVFKVGKILVVANLPIERDVINPLSLGKLRSYLVENRGRNLCPAGRRARARCDLFFLFFFFDWRLDNRRVSGGTLNIYLNITFNIRINIIVSHFGTLTIPFWDAYRLILGR